MTTGLAILVVEDEALIALAIGEELRREGAEVVGPCTTLKECLSTIDARRVDGAILDIDLHGETVFPAAERLRERGVPFVFHTGNSREPRLVRQFPGVKVCAKPMDVGELLDGLRGRLVRRYG